MGLVLYTKKNQGKQRGSCKVKWVRRKNRSATIRLHRAIFHFFIRIKVEETSLTSPLILVCWEKCEYYLTISQQVKRQLSSILFSSWYVWTVGVLWWPFLIVKVTHPEERLSEKVSRPGWPMGHLWGNLLIVLIGVGDPVWKWAAPFPRLCAHGENELSMLSLISSPCFGWDQTSYLKPLLLWVLGCDGL